MLRVRSHILRQVPRLVVGSCALALLLAQSGCCAFFGNCPNNVFIENKGTNPVTITANPSPQQTLPADIPAGDTAEFIWDNNVTSATINAVDMTVPIGDTLVDQDVTGRPTRLEWDGTHLKVAPAPPRFAEPWKVLLPTNSRQ